MLSVIIPVVNESETIGQIVTMARAHPDVDEVIVVDDGSLDDTPQQAQQAGARVLTSTFLGKGASMRDGVHEAVNKILIFLDADLRDVSPTLIDVLAEPLLANRADLCKANFAGSASPVNQLTAVPLVRSFFPELHAIQCPVAGTWAVRRSLLQKLSIENDYGGDVGVLLDAVAEQARIVEADVGHASSDEESTEILATMAQQVTRTILNRAARQGRLKPSVLEEAQESERCVQVGLDSFLQRVHATQRLALIGMDNIVVRGQYILDLAHQIGKGPALAELLDNPELPRTELLPRIAALFAGVPRETIEQVAYNMPLMPGARETIIELRKRGYLVGVVTDSFQVAAEIIRCRVFADFCISHLLRYQRGKATGRMTFAPAMTHPEGCKVHPHCHVNILHHLVEQTGMRWEDILVVGHRETHICMLQKAGLAVVFRPTRSSVRAAAQHVLEGSLFELLGYLPEEEPLIHSNAQST